MKKIFIALTLSVCLSGTVEAKPHKNRPVAARKLNEYKASRPKVICLRNPAVPEGKLDISERICEGKKILAKQLAETGYCSTEIKVCRGKGKRQKCLIKEVTQFCRHSILLAAMDLKGSIKVVKVDAQSGQSTTPGYSVRLKVRDGVDSEYDVKAPPGQLVIAMQFPLQMRMAHGIVLEKAIYTPYTHELRDAYPELVILGWNYLNNSLAEARTRIEQGGVSLQNIDPRVIFSLVMIEHFSNEELSNEEVEEEMYRVTLTLGANGPAAYKYSVSSTGARGIGQFMPKTWASLKRRYSKLLTQEFFAGTADHREAMIAQHLLALEDFNFLLNQRNWRNNSPLALKLLSEPKEIGIYLALAYNGGAPRAYHWLESGKTMLLPSEGAKYIRKFNQVWQVLEHLANEAN